MTTTTLPVVTADPAVDLPPPPPTSKPAPRRIFWADAASRVLAALAVAALAFVGYLLGISPLQHDRAQSVLRDALADQLAAQTAPAGGAIATGSPVALLRIPALKVDEVVVEGTGGGQLDDGPGHRPASPLPGQPGTAVIFGRSLTFGAPFRHLDRLKPGDVVTVSTVQGEHSYLITGVRRAGAPLPPPLRPGEGRMTLVGMEGGGRFGGDRLGADRTVYVDGSLTTPAQEAPPGRSRVQWAQEAPLAADDTGFIPLVLWLQLLALAVAGLTWALHRWGRLETWMIGLPVVLALGVQVFHLATVTLLPNLL
ncbi:sortase [Micromonospora sp. NPDC000089]|uniref:sortase n=1 Tax=unclassified Micromonospora TaxID=2617518 RepID=UPI0036D0F7A9